MSQTETDSKDSVAAAAAAVDSTIQQLDDMIASLEQDTRSQDTSTYIQKSINELIGHYQDVEAKTDNLKEEIPVDVVQQVDYTEQNNPKIYEQFVRKQYSDIQESVEQRKQVLLQSAEELQKRIDKQQNDDS